MLRMKETVVLWMAWFIFLCICYSSLQLPRYVWAAGVAIRLQGVLILRSLTHRNAGHCLAATAALATATRDVRHETQLSH